MVGSYGRGGTYSGRRKASSARARFVVARNLKKHPQLEELAVGSGQRRSAGVANNPLERRGKLDASQTPLVQHPIRGKKKNAQSSLSAAESSSTIERGSKINRGVRSSGKGEERGIRSAAFIHPPEPWAEPLNSMEGAKKQTNPTTPGVQKERMSGFQ